MLAGFLLAAVGLPLLTWVLSHLREHMGLPSVLLLFLLLVIAVSAVGGLWPALTAAVAGFLLVNWYFTPPLNTFTVGEGENVLALVVFVAVAGLVSAFVALSARRAVEGARARSEAEALARLAGSSSVDDLLESLRRAFGFDAAGVLHRTGAEWRLDASSGPASSVPGEATITVEVDPKHLLVVTGSNAASQEDRPILQAYARELAASLQLEELEAAASTAGSLAAANELRTALLTAVSHDLRTPLAAIKASVTSLLQEDVDWTAAERNEFLATIHEETDRLDALVGNLLDMSRLQTGSVELHPQPISLDEVIPAALQSLGPRGAEVTLDLPEDVPPVNADAGLLERALANIVANAAAYSPEAFLAARRCRCGRRRRRHPDRRPRAWGADTRARPHVSSLPTPRGREPRRSRARPRGRTRLHRGDERLDRARGHTRRGTDCGRPTRGCGVTRILVVDDEPQILRALGTNLRARGYDVDLAPTGENALELAARKHPDLVILDLGLPGIDGVDVIRGLRGWTSVPIVVLSVREREADKVAALDAGADDYVTKPFGMDELLARLRAALRRAAPAEEQAVVETPDFTVDLADKRVTRDGAEVRLTPTEWQIVELLVRNPGKLVSQRQLLQDVWGPQYQDETNYLRVYLAQIRRKLEPDPARPRYFITEPRMGYRFINTA